MEVGRCRLEGVASRGARRGASGRESPSSIPGRYAIPGYGWEGWPAPAGRLASGGTLGKALAPGASW